MAESVIFQGEIDEDADPTFTGLVVTADGVALQTGDVQANGVTMNVFDSTSQTPATIISSQSGLDPSTTYNGFQLLSNTLQTTGWTKAGDGYNFRYLVAAAPIGMKGGHVYRFEFLFALNPASSTPGLGSGTAVLKYDLTVRPIMSS